MGRKKSTVLWTIGLLLVLDLVRGDVLDDLEAEIIQGGTKSEKKNATNSIDGNNLYKTGGLNITDAQPGFPFMFNISTNTRNESTVFTIGNSTNSTTVSFAKIARMLLHLILI